MLKHKIKKLNAVLLMVLGLTSLHGQNSMNVKTTSGSQTTYTLSSIRKLTFPSEGSMVVTKTTGITDSYILNSLRYLDFSVGTDIDSNTELGEPVRLYPNPVQDLLSIQVVIAENENATLEILSIEGKVVYKAQLINSYKINVSHLGQGIYLCRLKNGSSIKTTKFIKK